MMEGAAVDPLTLPWGQKLNVACGAVLPTQSFTSRSWCEARKKIRSTTFPTSSRMPLDFSAGTVSGGGGVGAAGFGLAGFFFGGLPRLAITATGWGAKKP